MRNAIFSIASSVTIVAVDPTQRVVFYGAEVIVAGGVPPDTVQFVDTIPTVLSPALNKLIPGVVHHLPVNYEDGVPVSRALGAKGSHMGILVAGGTTPNVAGTVYYDFQ